MTDVRESSSLYLSEPPHECVGGGLSSDVMPAARYQVASDLLVVTVHFNPSRYRTRNANLDRFLTSIRSAGLPLRVVECAFGDDPWVLAGDDVVRVRARDVLWQKERLINLALRGVPSGLTKVAWVDGDILFENPDWAVETSRVLEEVPIAQCFSRAIRLPRGRDVYRGEGSVSESFALVKARKPRAHTRGRYDAHGHTGFAWAARLELLERHGVYDAHMASNNDHLIAHAIVGDIRSPCIGRMLGDNARAHAHFARWATRFYREVRGRLGVVDGAALHLWHGDPAHRKHVERARELAQCEIDPSNDIIAGPDGCWEWATSRPDLRSWAIEFFKHRHEDGLNDSIEAPMNA